MNAMAMMAVWKRPQALPDDAPVQVTSNEINVQNNRMATLPPVNYASESVVPISPTLLNEVEKALELSSMNTSAPNDIPFFIPQAPVPPPAMAAPAYPPLTALPPNPSTEADISTVLMMGLPLFLVGSNLQALQTLAAAPGLLDTFKDVNGVYDQPRLINLVQTLAQNVAPASAPPQNFYQHTAGLALPGQAQGMYSTPAVGSIPATQQPASRGYRGDQNLNEANLHLSGYGPMTTPDEIIALFAPYVHVTEVVPKSNFSFVNTRDPDGARRAREALNGALLGGQPVRINLATRKAKNPMHETTATIPAPPPVPLNSIGQVDVDQVSKYLQLFYFVCIQFYPTNDALFMHDRFETTVAILQQRISSSQATDLPRRNNN